MVWISRDVRIDTAYPRHGRDNIIHIWSMPTERSSAILNSGAMTDLPAPALVMDLPVNALNYCGYAMVTLASEESSLKAYIVVPHTLESAWIDVYELPTKRRVVEALGRPDIIVPGAHRPAIVMSIQARIHSHRLDIVSGMEDGHVTAWSLSLETWEAQQLWSYKSHIETVLCLYLAPCHDFVVSVGADRSIVHLRLESEAKPSVYTAQRPGQACVAIRDDERIVAVGSWDGTTRIYANPNMELLVTLKYHKESVQAVAFPRSDRVHVVDTLDDTSSYEDDEDETKMAPYHLPPWLACGSKDGRISLWKLPVIPDHTL